MEKKRVILTGDRPTGKLHIGHYAGSLKNRVKLMEEGNYDEFYVFIADCQALTDNVGKPQKIEDSVVDVALDYLAIGLDPARVTLFIQSQVPQMAEMALYLANFVTVATLERNPTLKEEIKARGMDASLPVGFFTYPVSQAADIACFDTTLVPAGEDQSPMVEQCREIVRRVNTIYGSPEHPILVEPEILVPKQEYCRRLPGTDGRAKMSKSLNNCIYLSDSSKEVHDKVFSMFTDPTHLRKDDPGHTENNPVFIYLSAFCTDEDFARYLPQYRNLDEMKAHYERGGLGDVTCKKFLFQVLEGILAPIRERRAYWENHLDEVFTILNEGCKRAERKAAGVMDRLKAALKVDYLTNEAYKAAQRARYERKD